jgi:uncharacterized membrane protein YqjE
MSAAPGGSSAPSGIMESVRSFLATWVAVLKTRVEIISVEIEEQREWIEQLILLAVAALFCLSLGLILLTLFFVVLFWETGRLWVLGGFAVLYLGGGGLLWLLLRQKLRAKPKLFSATAAELGKDYAALQPRAP